MANHKSAKKRIRSDARKRENNRAYMSRMRTTIRQAREAIEAGDEAEASQRVHKAISLLDKAANKGIIHKNNAARRKSRLIKHLNTLRNPEEA